jgi:hypothetical protein
MDLLKHQRAEREITQQLQMRRNQSSTYTEPLPVEDAAYLAKSFTHQLDPAVIQALLDKYPDSIAAHYRWLVPSKVSSEDFWLRYFWRCDAERALKNWSTAERAKEANPFEAALKHIQLNPVVQNIQKFFDDLDDKKKKVNKKDTKQDYKEIEEIDQDEKSPDLDRTFDMTVDTSDTSAPEMTDETSGGSNSGSWQPVLKLAGLQESPSEVTFTEQSAAAVEPCPRRTTFIISSLMLMMAVSVAFAGWLIAPTGLICAPMRPGLTLDGPVSLRGPWWAPAAYKGAAFDMACSSSSSGAAPAQLELTKQKKGGLFSLAVSQDGKTKLTARNLISVDVSSDSNLVLHKKKGRETIIISW